jgi:hypothetical protein
VPATLAAERAAAAVRARTDTIERRMAAQRRHPNVEDLLNREDDAGSSGN